MTVRRRSSVMRLARVIVAALVAAIAVGLMPGPRAFAVLNDAGPVSINDGYEFTRDGHVQVGVPADGATHVRLSNNDSDWAEFLYVSEVSWYLVDPLYGGVSTQGTKTVYVQWRDELGIWSPSQSDSIVFDRTAPDILNLHHRFSVPGRAGVGALPTTVSWSATDYLSGLASVTVQEWTDDPRATVHNKFVTVPLSNPLATSVRRALRPGATYKYRMRARDRAGNTSGWLTTAEFEVAARLARHGSYSGTWQSRIHPKALGGALRVSDEAGASATFHLFNVSDVGLVAARGPRGGRADIYRDGFFAATINLQAPTVSYRRVVWSWNWRLPGTHTIKVVVRGTPGHPRVWLDAILRDSWWP